MVYKMLKYLIQDVVFISFLKRFYLDFTFWWLNYNKINQPFWKVRGASSARGNKGKKFEH